MSIAPNQERYLRPSGKLVSGVEPMPSDTASACDFSLEESPDWWVLQTRARFERRMSNQLPSQHRQAFVPVARERRRWTDRYETLELPMFPGYVFVRAVLKATDRLAILQSSGVFGFVTYKGSLAHVSDRQVGYLRSIVEHNNPWSPYRFIAEGPQARIRSGQLGGLEGILATDKAGRKLVISLDPMQRSIAISVETCDLEML
ncbi:MAG: transcription termination/antitermination NusG family protein [Candidatus Korobacteraceae bacterium]